MISKTIFFILGLVALCYAQPPCRLELWKTGSPGFIYTEETNDVAPFTGWNEVDPNTPGAQQFTYSSVNGGAASFCDECILTFYSTNGVEKSYFNLETSSQFILPFCAKSYSISCDNKPPEEEEEEEQDESEELSFEPWTFTPEVIVFRDQGLADAVSLLIDQSRIPNTQYTLVDAPDNAVEKSVNFDTVYSFHLTVEDPQNKEWIIEFWFVDNAPASYGLYYNSQVGYAKE